jgi:hypothetical protein
MPDWIFSHPLCFDYLFRFLDLHLHPYCLFLLSLSRGVRGKRRKAFAVVGRFKTNKQATCSTRMRQLHAGRRGGLRSLRSVSQVPIPL